MPMIASPSRLRGVSVNGAGPPPSLASSSGLDLLSSSASQANMTMSSASHKASSVGYLSSLVCSGLMVPRLSTPHLSG